MITRRNMLKLVAGLPFMGGLAGWGVSHLKESDTRYSYRDFFKELGLRTFINATGTHTYLTGSLMLPEVMQAINYSSEQYVDYNELQDKAGERIAQLLDCEEAMVTAGAASALTLGTAAFITGKDATKIHLLPNLPGPPLEVIIQRRHRFSYDHAVHNTGIRFVEVETRQQLENAVNDRTIMMLFMNASNFWGQIQDEEFVELGKKYDIPTFNDCAADVPPVENLWKYTRIAFDHDEYLSFCRRYQGRPDECPGQIPPFR